MVTYMGDLMEDTDFSWQSAKAAHAVMLCEMERGVLTWEDTERIDRIRGAHAQKHLSSYKQGWAKSGENGFAKTFNKAFVVTVRSMIRMVDHINTSVHSV